MLLAPAQRAPIKLFWEKRLSGDRRRSVRRFGCGWPLPACCFQQGALFGSAHGAGECGGSTARRHARAAGPATAEIADFADRTLAGLPAGAGSKQAARAGWRHAQKRPDAALARALALLDPALLLPGRADLRPRSGQRRRVLTELTVAASANRCGLTGGHGDHDLEFSWPARHRPGGVSAN